MSNQPFRSQWSFDVSELNPWLEQFGQVHKVLSESIGFNSLQMLRCPDEPQRYVVQSTWQDVGSYRRATSSTAAKLVVWPFLVNMIDAPSTFETLVEITPDSYVEYQTSVSES